MNLYQRYLSSFRGLSSEVWKLSVVGLVNRLGMMVLPYLLLYLTSELDYSATRAGAVLAIYGVGTLSGIALGGKLTDRFGYRPVQLWSLWLSGLCLIAMGQLAAGPGLVACIFLFGLTSDAYRPANMAALAHHSDALDRSRAYGLYRLAINLGWSVGPAIGGFLALVDYELLFWIDGLTTLASGVYLQLALGPPGEQPGHGSSTEATSGQEPAPAAQSDSAGQAGSELPSPGGSPWRDGPFVVALGLLLLQCLVFFQLSSTFPLFLQEQRGLGTNVIGCLMLVNTLMIVLLEMPLIARVDRFPKLKLIALSSLFVGLGFGMLPVATNLMLIALGLALWTIGEMLSAPMMSTWVSERADEGNRGRYMAAFGMCFSAAQILAPLLGTWAYQHLGPDWPWYACLALGALSCAGFWLLRRFTD